MRYLKKEDIALLASFGEMFGSTDTCGQIANCSLHAALLNDKLEQARRKKERCTSLSMGLGAVAGVGIIIIFM